MKRQDIVAGWVEVGELFVGGGLDAGNLLMVDAGCYDNRGFLEQQLPAKRVFTQLKV